MAGFLRIFIFFGLVVLLVAAISAPSDAQYFLRKKKEDSKVQNFKTPSPIINIFKKPEKTAPEGATGLPGAQASFTPLPGLRERQGAPASQILSPELITKYRSAGQCGPQEKQLLKSLESFYELQQSFPNKAGLNGPKGDASGPSGASYKKLQDFLKNPAGAEKTVEILSACTP